jgi:hypothetical protein
MSGAWHRTWLPATRRALVQAHPPTADEQVAAVLEAEPFVVATDAGIVREVSVATGCSASSSAT